VDAALGEAELGEGVGHGGHGEVRELAEAEGELAGLELGVGRLVGVDAVAGGEGQVGFGGAELVDAGGLDGDVAEQDADAGHATGRVDGDAGVVEGLVALGLVLRGVVALGFRERGETKGEQREQEGWRAEGLHGVRTFQARLAARLAV
jgi:hypothetical protein